MWQSFNTLWATVPWELWSVGAIGLLVGCLIFLVGRGRASAPRDPETEGVLSMAHLLRATKLDRRSMPRRRGNGIEVDFAAEPGGEDPIPGTVVDRSVGGLGVEVDQPLEVGARLFVRVRTAPRSVPWTPVAVKMCRPRGSTWEVGCQFLESPAMNVLMLFG
jgi:hypothetical protein